MRSPAPDRIVFPALFEFDYLRDSQVTTTPASTNMNTPPDSLDDLAWFIRIAEAGSLSRASRQFDVPKSTLSQRLLRVEEARGEPLVQRNSRSFHLTEAGSRLIDEMAPLIRRLEVTSEALRKGDEPARGVVRMTASVSFSKYVVLPLITEFLLAHPEVTIEAEMTDKRINLLEHGLDFGLRIGDLPDSGMKTRTIGALRRVLCASASYAKKYGLPETPDRLTEHACLLQSRAASTVTLEGPGGLVQVAMSARLILEPSDQVLVPVQMGLGIAALPEIQVARLLASGALIQVLPQWRVPAHDVQLLYPMHRHQAPAVRRLMDFLISAVPLRIAELVAKEAAPQ
ncbi:LysR family transcriptional regulator [Variovorax boronicumulans]|uniref:LysR family transcriptional regulator n=1 Tax=Variovorax boronicumulans TaxID=436515 RepID=UPI00277EB9C6|nr:LysR family transcriptional regulator [Variovorax boronicumulans]MDQ0043125.1 DNA-binding transcriptional LysR family regulator [Variovorax boronicumulans]